MARLPAREASPCCAVLLRRPAVSGLVPLARALMFEAGALMFEAGTQLDHDMMASTNQPVHRTQRVRWVVVLWMRGPWLLWSLMWRERGIQQGQQVTCIIIALDVQALGRASCLAEPRNLNQLQPDKPAGKRPKRSTCKKVFLSILTSPCLSGCEVPALSPGGLLIWCSCWSASCWSWRACCKDCESVLLVPVTPCVAQCTVPRA